MKIDSKEFDAKMKKSIAAYENELADIRAGRANPGLLDKIEIDYLQKKNVKKPNGSAPGFVVYYTNFSLTVHPDISGLTLVE